MRNNASHVRATKRKQIQRERGRTVSVEPLEQRTLMSGSVVAAIARHGAAHPVFTAAASVGDAGALTATATVKGPATVIAGQKIAATIVSTLTNTGTTAYSDSITFSAYLSASGTVDNNSTGLVTSGAQQLSIDPNKGITARATIRSVPLGTIPAIYHYIVEFKNSNGSTTTFQPSNTVTVVAPHIDIAGSFARFTSTARHGRPYTENIIVSNSGANVAAVGQLSIVVGYLPTDGNAPIGALPVIIKRKISLKPNKTLRIPVTVKAPQAGVYSLFVHLDGSAITNATDSNLLNNVLTPPTTFKVS